MKSATLEISYVTDGAYVDNTVKTHFLFSFFHFFHIGTAVMFYVCMYIYMSILLHTYLLILCNCYSLAVLFYVMCICHIFY